MPGGNRTGPAGMGPMTGRAAGLCAGYSVPGYMNPIAGGGFLGSAPYGNVAPGYAGRYVPYGQAGHYGGFGRSFGFGRGFGRGWSGRGRGLGRGRW